MAWADYYNWDYTRFVVERFDRRGRSTGVLHQDSFSYAPAMAMNAAGDFILVRGGGRSLLGQRYDKAGSAVGPSFQVHSDAIPNPSDPAIALARDGSFVVAWRAWKQNGFVVDVHARRFDAAAAPLGDEIQVNTYGESPNSESHRQIVSSGHDPQPDVAIAPDGSSLVVWSSAGQDGDEGGIFGRRLDDRGRPVGAEFQINSFTAFDQRFPSVAFDASGNAVVAWQSVDQDGSGTGIFAKRFSAAAGSNDTDGDGDGVSDALDNCPTVANADQADAGSDFLGDGCVAPDVVIHPTAQLGFNPIIEQSTVIAAGVVIGDNAVIGEAALLERQARAGNRVRLGDRVTVGSRAAIGNDVTVGADTRIESGASLGDGAGIGDSVTTARNVVVGPRATIGPLVVVDIGARIGRGATVETGARVGRRAIVRNGAVVPAGTTVAPGATFPREGRARRWLCSACPA